MGKLIGKCITHRGMELIAKKILSLDNTEFTRFAAGNGNVETIADQEQMEHLISEKISFSIIGKRIENKTTVLVTGRLSNYPEDSEPLDEGFLITEVGLYANDPDIGEILYSVYFFEHEYLSAFDGVFISKLDFSLYTNVAKSENVTITVNPNMYAGAQELQELTEKVERYIEECQKAHKEFKENATNIYVSKDEPTDWKPGDLWAKEISRQVFGDETEILLHTRPYDPNGEYELKTGDLTETVDNIGEGKELNIIMKDKS